jgi:hypothetical protein
VQKEMKMNSIPFFPQFFAYAPMVFAVAFFLLSYSQKQYESWDQNFGQNNAKRILIFMRYIAPPLMILCGVVQLLLR